MNGEVVTTSGVLHTALSKLSEALEAMNEQAARAESNTARGHAALLQVLQSQRDHSAMRFQEINYRLEALANALNRMEKSKRWI